MAGKSAWDTMRTAKARRLAEQAVESMRLYDDSMRVTQDDIDASPPPTHRFEPLVISEARQRQQRELRALVQRKIDALAQAIGMSMSVDDLWMQISSEAQKRGPVTSANRARVKRRRWAYHGTSAEALPSIAEVGLQPYPALNGHGVFFVESPSAAPGVVLRFPWPKRDVHVDQSSDEEHAFYYVRTSIPSGAIEVLRPPSHPFDDEDDRWWVPIRGASQ
jgi:hypothetical protein